MSQINQTSKNTECWDYATELSTTNPWDVIVIQTVDCSENWDDECGTFHYNAWEIAGSKDVLRPPMFCKRKKEKKAFYKAERIRLSQLEEDLKVFDFFFLISLFLFLISLFILLNYLLFFYIIYFVNLFILLTYLHFFTLFLFLIAIF